MMAKVAGEITCLRLPFKGKLLFRKICEGVKTTREKEGEREARRDACRK